MEKLSRQEIEIIKEGLEIAKDETFKRKWLYELSCKERGKEPTEEDYEKIYIKINKINHALKIIRQYQETYLPWED